MNWRVLRYQSARRGNNGGLIPNGLQTASQRTEGTQIVQKGKCGILTFTPIAFAVARTSSSTVTASSSAIR